LLGILAINRMEISPMQSLNQDSKLWIESTIKTLLRKNLMVKLFSKTSVDSSQFMIKIKLPMLNTEITKFQLEA